MATAAKKVEMSPDEVYVQEALREGRAKLQNELSMKALGKPDVRFQARVKHIDMDHVHRLDLILQQDGKLSPVVVFRAIEKAKIRMILADGFHRHDVYRRANRDAIRAYVIDVPMDQIEREARMFSAMCNQNLSLGRTPQDIRKAAEMLFSDPECWKWSDAMIARHCGTSCGTATKWRAGHMAQTGKNPPDKVLRSDGTETSYGNYKRSKLHLDKKGHFIKKIDGKKFDLGANENDAKEKLSVIQETIKAKADKIDPYELNRFLASQGFSFRSCNGVGLHAQRLPGHCGHGIIYVVTCFDNERDIATAVGTLILLKIQMSTPNARLMVACYPEEGPKEMMDLARKLDIEFLTPHELVAFLKDQDQLVESLKGQEVAPDELS